MYYYTQNEYFGDEFIYAYDILDKYGHKVATVYYESDAKNLIAALNGEENKIGEKDE